LKDLANKSELSDWFNREDAPALTAPLPERPNPKNAQNEEKITELEEQIKRCVLAIPMPRGMLTFGRLKAEKDALEALLRPPAIVPTSQQLIRADLNDLSIDKSLLSATDAALLDSLGSSSNLSVTIASRLNTITSKLGPSIDTFANGVHTVAQYRDAANNVAGRILGICAERLSDREREGRRKALHQENDSSPGQDLSSVLRGLSRVDR